MATPCPICGAVQASGEAKGHALVEGIMLGIVLERVAQHTQRNVSSLICAEHLQELRRLADIVPFSVIPATDRHLLSFGLTSVKA